MTTKQTYTYCLLMLLLMGSVTPLQAQEKHLERRQKRVAALFDNQLRKQQKADTARQITDNVIADSLHVDSLLKADSTIVRLVYLLPLHADAVKRDKNMDRFYDFYAGSLIAIYEAQAHGQHMEIHTYDIGKTAQHTQEVIAANPEIREADAVIGPAYSQQVAIVMDSLQKDSVWQMIPFLSRVPGIDRHPFAVKFNPSGQIEADTVARYLAQRSDSTHCVLIEAKDDEVIPTSIKALHQALKEYNVPSSTISLKAILSDSIENAFQREKENIVIFNTERFANLQTVMPHLLKACGNYRITLFSHYSWQKEKIILPQLYTSVFASMPIVPDSYEQLFEKYFGHELSSIHPRYDLLGYDLTNYLLNMLTHKSDTIAISQELYEGVQASMQYLPTTPGGGYENHIIHIIHQ